MRGLMSRSLVLWALVGMLTLPAAARQAPAPDGPGQRTLLESAEYWRKNARADLARQALEKYLQTRPGDARAWYRLGMLGIRTGEPGRCTAVVRDMRERLPQDPHTSALAGQCRVATDDRLAMAAVRRLAEEERFAEAAEAFRDLFDNDIPAGRLGLEYLQLRERAGDDWSALQQDYRRLAESFPDDDAIQLAFSGHLAERRATAREAIRRLRSQSDDTDNRSRVLRYWRTALRQVSDAPDISRLVAEYLTVDPDNGEFRRMAARLARSDARARAGMLMEAGSYRQAEELLRPAVGRFPDDPWLRYDLARVLIATDRPAEARAVIESGVTRQPGAPEMRYMAALIYNALAQSEAALAQLEAIPSDRRSDTVRELRGRLAFTVCLGQTGEALLDCAIPAGRDPERWQRLVDIWFARDLAAAGLTRMAQWRDVHDPGPALDRVWAGALARAGRHDEALAVIRRIPAGEGAGALPATELMDWRVRLSLSAFDSDGQTDRLARLTSRLDDGGDEFPAASRHRWLGALHLALGNRAQARHEYQALLSCCQPTPEDRLALAPLLAGVGDRNAAEAQLRAAYLAADTPATRATVAQTAFDLLGPTTGRPLLAAALAEDPDNAWLRHDLARTLISLGEPDAAGNLMREGVERQPDRAEMRFAAGLILESLGERGAALSQVESVPERERSDGMRALAARMRFERCLTAAGDEPSLLSECETHAGDDPGRRARLALARIRAGQAGPALAAFQQWRGSQPEDPAVALAALRVYDAAGRDMAFRVLLDDWVGRSDLAPDTRLAFDRAEADWRLARGGDEQALQPVIERLEAAAEQAADPAPPRRLLGHIRMALSQPGRAAEQYALIVDRPAAVLTDRIAYAESLYQADRPAAARDQLDRAWSSAGTLDEQLAVAEAWRAAPADPAPNPYLATLQDRPPSDYRVTAAAADQALAEDRPADALTLLEQAQAQAPPTEQPDLASRAQAVRDRRQALLAGGFDLATVPGVAGISDRRLATAMLEWRHPVNWDDQLVLKLDATRMGVGRLTAGDAVDFGQFATLSAGGRDPFFPQPETEETGLGVGLGYEGDHWRLDLGTTPLGFPEPFLVGGIRYTGRVGRHQWQAGVSRRAVTSTFLSYAGDTDPVSGQFWGAARADGLQLGLARYEATYSYALSLYPHRITGENIPDNKGVIAQARASREVYRRPGLSLSLGAYASHWAYDLNQRFYTFGQGGYYSPQAFTTFSLPVFLQGGINRWSYSVQVGAAYTRSREDDADYYPDRPGLQTAARAAGETPVYAGGSGSGTSVQLDVSAEYALTEGMAIGARYAINRADFYEPDFFTIYLRHNLGSGTRSLRVPPQRIGPYRDW